MPFTRKEIQQRYRDKHKARLDEEKKQWLIDNPDKRKATTKKYREKVKPQMEQHRRDNYEWYIWNNIRSKCKKYGHAFDLTLEDIVIPEVCPYLGVPMTRIVGQGRQDFNPSVDRIDPTKGYTKYNVEIMSDKANRMKNNATKDELVTFAKEILRRYGGHD